LLANLKESRTIIEAVLQKLPDLFKGTQNPNNNLGAALQAATKLIVRR